jgi:RNase P subunit RPR2
MSNKHNTHKIKPNKRVSNRSQVDQRKDIMRSICSTCMKTKMRTSETQFVSKKKMGWRARQKTHAGPTDTKFGQNYASKQCVVP